jgi:protein O-GlcNAc transferase
MILRQQLESGISHHQGGRLVEAEALYRQVLAQQPDHAEAIYLLGMVVAQSGRSDEAIGLIRRSIELNPNSVGAHYNLGIIFQGLGRPDDAIHAYQQAIRLKPDYVEALNNLGNALVAGGRLGEAIESYRHVVRLKPDWAEVHSNLGLALTEANEFEAAIASHRRAVSLKPERAESRSNLGAALAKSGQIAEAIAVFRQAIVLKPDLAEAHTNLASALFESGHPDAAIAAGRQAVRFKPNYAMAHDSLGNALKETGQLDEAIACFRMAVRLNLGDRRAHSNLIFTLHFHPDHEGRMIQDEARRWNLQHAQPLARLIGPHTNNRNPDRRLRIGYLSPEFRDHCQSMFTIPLLSNHNREAFEIFCYSQVVRSDDVTERIRGYTDGWRSIVGMTDAEAAKKIREDRIDILIDLTMHMGSNRLAIFAHKPAPVQVAWLAYPGSTGLSAMDYRITDPFLDPPGSNDHFHSEKSIRLPSSFWCYDPLSTEPAVNPLPAETNGHVTFGCLNNFCKVNEPVLRLWGQVLNTVDRSRMMILCPNGSHRQPMLELFRREGITLDRIELIARRPRPQYLALYHRIDVGLDTFPYNGHTTSLDAFWMGVPVVTLVGKTVVGRAGLSQLTNLGLRELIARTPQEYVGIAAGLASDLPRLSELRRTLRQRMQASPLMDAARFARDMEAEFRRIWQGWCRARDECQNDPPP